MEDTLEKRILKSNLSDEDKIEIIRRLSSKEYIYVPQPTCPQPINTPLNPWCPNQLTITYCCTTAGPYLSNSGLRC